MKNLRKSAAFFLAFLMILSAVLLSCAEEPDDDIITQSGDSQNAAETEPPYEFLKGGLDFNGFKFNILYSSSSKINEVAVPPEEIEGGDIINEAIYTRNQLTETLLNISISAVEGEGWETLPKEVEKSVLAGGNDYNAVCGSLKSVFNSAAKEHMTDIGEIETIDLNNMWWEKAIIDTFDFGGGKTFMINGDINYLDDYGITCIYFNKTLFDKYNLDYPYDSVKNGDWTYEVFNTTAKDAYKDLNGDGKPDAYDKYGFISNGSIAANMLTGFNAPSIIRNEAGIYEFILTEEYFDKYSVIIDGFCNSESTVIMERKFGYEIGNEIFNYGNTLYMDNLIRSSNEYRMLEFDIGIIPFPKYNAEQEYYCSNVNEAESTAYGVPFGNDGHTVGYILDVMGYYSTDTVSDAVIEKNIMIKGTRDEESYDMLNIIFKTKTYELAYVFGWGNYFGNTVINMVYNGKNTLASSYEKIKPKIDSAISEYVEQFTK